MSNLYIAKLVYIILSTWRQSWKYTLQSNIITEKKKKSLKQVVADLGDQKESLSLLASLGDRISIAWALLTFMWDSQINPGQLHGKFIRTTNKPCSGMDRISRSALLAIRWSLEPHETYNWLIKNNLFQNNL